MKKSLVLLTVLIAIGIAVVAVYMTPRVAHAAPKEKTIYISELDFGPYVVVWTFYNGNGYEQKLYYGVSGWMISIVGSSPLRYEKHTGAMTGYIAITGGKLKPRIKTITLSIDATDIPHGTGTAEWGWWDQAMILPPGALWDRFGIELPIQKGKNVTWHRWETETDDWQITIDPNGNMKIDATFTNGYVGEVDPPL